MSVKNLSFCPYEALPASLMFAGKALASLGEAPFKLTLLG
jgi:hypothetical protein